MLYFLTVCLCKVPSGGSAFSMTKRSLQKVHGGGWPCARRVSQCLQHRASVGARFQSPPSYLQSCSLVMPAGKQQQMMQELGLPVPTCKTWLRFLASGLSGPAQALVAAQSWASRWKIFLPVSFCNCAFQKQKLVVHSCYLLVTFFSHRKFLFETLLLSRKWEILVVSIAR